MNFVIAWTVGLSGVFTAPIGADEPKPQTPPAKTAAEADALPLGKPVNPQNQRIADALKEVINRGADVYNSPSSDHAGCYRLFQGALMVVRIQLDAFPELQKEIESTLAEAERQGSFSQRAFTLRRGLDRIRSTLLGRKAEESKQPGV